MCVCISWLWRSPFHWSTSYFQRREAWPRGWPKCIYMLINVNDFPELTLLISLDYDQHIFPSRQKVSRSNIWWATGYLVFGVSFKHPCFVGHLENKRFSRQLYNLWEWRRCELSFDVKMRDFNSLGGGNCGTIFSEYKFWWYSRVR